MGAARRERAARERAAALTEAGKALSGGREDQVAAELGRLKNPRGFLLYFARIEGAGVIGQALAVLEERGIWD